MLTRVNDNLELFEFSSTDQLKPQLKELADKSGTVAQILKYQFSLNFAEFFNSDQLMKSYGNLPWSDNYDEYISISIYPWKSNVNPTVFKSDFLAINVTFDDFFINIGLDRSQIYRLNPLRAKFFRGNINIYLHFMSFLHTNKTQVVEIHPWVRQGPAYST